MRRAEEESEALDLSSVMLPIEGGKNALGSFNTLKSPKLFKSIQKNKEVQLFQNLPKINLGGLLPEQQAS